MAGTKGMGKKMGEDIKDTSDKVAKAVGLKKETPQDKVEKSLQEA